MSSPRPPRPASTTLALSDHDAVAGVPEAAEAAESHGIELVPAVEMSCVHEYAEDLHVCGYWVDVDAIAPACERAQQERVNRAEEIIEQASRAGLRRHARGRDRAVGRRAVDRPPPHREGRRRHRRPRSLLRGVPRPRRQGVRAAALAHGRAGHRADQRRRRRRRGRPSLLGRQGPRAGRGPGPRASLGRRRGLLPLPLPRADRASAAADRGARHHPDRLIGLPRPDAQDVRRVRRVRHLRPR